MLKTRLRFNSTTKSSKILKISILRLQEEEFEFSSVLHPLINRCIIKSIGFISIPGNYTTFQFYDKKLENIEDFHSSTPQEEEFEFSSVLHSLINHCIIKFIGFISIPGNYTTFQFYDKKLENIENFHSSTPQEEEFEFSSVVHPLINR